MKTLHSFLKEEKVVGFEKGKVKLCTESSVRVKLPFVQFFLFNCTRYYFKFVKCYFVFQYFQKELPSRAEADPEALMQSAYSMKYNAKKMKKLEKEYAVIKSKEQEEMAELKVFYIKDFTHTV